MKYKVNYSDTAAHTVVLKDGKIFLNDEESTPDVAFIGGNRYHILLGASSFMMEVLENDLATKKFKIKVNDHTYELRLEDELDMLLEKMGMSSSGNTRMDNVKAPMPGLVLKVLVAPGQEVEKGDSLIILEAMKMENVIKASGPGIVKNICVQIKDAVDKNQILIEME
jgi:biotin carboxyl carrier protein